MPPAVPVATYRLQLNAKFSFADAAALVPYLKSLGISHLYASPFLKSRAGSTHGYDVVDHNAVDPELGGEQGLQHLCDALAEADMGLILDFVPNHMGIHYADNPWWLDVLEWGPKSPFAASFDIDWKSLPGHPRGGVLVPILGSSYGEALQRGEILLRYDPRAGSFSAWYYQHQLPIGPNRYGEILQKAVAQAGAGNEPAGRNLLEFAARYRGPHNPPRQSSAAFKDELAAIAGGQEVIERGLRAYDPRSGDSEAMLALHSLLERQHYRLADWRLAGSEINYRRFFDINDLAGLRVEDAATFEAVHRLVHRLIAQGWLHGLRLDHIDGLRDPHQYFRRLARLIDVEKPPGSNPLYVVTEKILAEGEHLPRFAGVSGTTGYEWLNVSSRLLLDERGLVAIDDIWREVSGDARRFDEILIEARRRVIANILASEFTVLARLLARIAAGHYTTRDYAAERLRAAFELFILHFPVYRTYITPSGPSRGDRAIINETIAKARADWFGPDVGIFDFLRDALTLDLISSGRTGYSIARDRQFAFKVQQFTGPMMAKSLEDTALYRYHRLLALNEVGGNPAAGALSVADFHKCMEERARRSSRGFTAQGSTAHGFTAHGLTATATHDTKRGEDARARLVALSELAIEWTESVREWRRLNASLIDSSGSQRVPAPTHEYMIYQSSLGAWPLGGVDASFVERMQAYAVKAAREGKQHTSWLAPDQSYETGLENFLGALLDRDPSASFIASFDAFARRAALMGALNSMTQLTLKTAMPGVPDFYQGTEFWDLSLVDPDNRRPVDFAARSAALASIGDAPDWPALAGTWLDGRVKLALTQRLLALRAQFADLFARGSYRALEVAGPHRNEIIAFARASGRNAVIVVTGRLFKRATRGGRQWPCGESWSASVCVDDFCEIAGVIVANKQMSGPGLAASELFGVLPIAVLQAKYAPVKTGSIGGKRQEKAVRDRLSRTASRTSCRPTEGRFPPSAIALCRQ
jgi:(1->4)-alpha-D-glucan 1-alpha-D-glucosylmutase